MDPDYNSPRIYWWSYCNLSIIQVNVSFPTGRWLCKSSHQSWLWIKSRKTVLKTIFCCHRDWCHAVAVVCCGTRDQNVEIGSTKINHVSIVILYTPYTTTCNIVSTYRVPISLLSENSPYRAYMVCALNQSLTDVTRSGLKQSYFFNPEPIWLNFFYPWYGDYPNPVKITLLKNACRVKYCLCGLIW